jgi:hypothetical protein
VRGVLAAVNGTEDSDTVGCMVGAMLGAEVGASRLPVPWQQSLEDPDGVRSLISRIPLTERRSRGPAQGWLPGLDLRGKA